MTESVQANPAKAGELAQQIVVLLQNESSDTRHRAVQAAMMLLGEEAPSGRSLEGPIPGVDSPGGDDTSDLGVFFTRDENLKPSDKAQLCAAYHFSTYGTAAFSLVELRTIASDSGIVLPDRLDMTLNQATRSEKKLFQSAGRGMFKPTVVAALVFKERWNVKPGRKSKQNVTTA
jgi:hypothetical protein